MRKHLFLLLLTLTLGQALKAQDKLTVYGAGRFSMHSGGVSGDVYDGLVIGADTLSPDTVSARSEMAGYALFDLGFQFRPNAQTEIKALTRVYSELDGFWGQGINFNFRELYVRGIVKGKVKYRVGDLDLKMSKFTLYNSNGDLGAHDNNATHLYEDIIQYENFFRNNSWRQQGLQTSFKLKLPGNGNRLDVMAFLAKNRQADYFFTPDRLLGGGMLSYEKLGWGKLDYYRTELFEIAETAPFSGQAQRISTQSIAGTVKNPKLGRKPVCRTCTTSNSSQSQAPKLEPFSNWACAKWRKKRNYTTSPTSITWKANLEVLEHNQDETTLRLLLHSSHFKEIRRM